MGNCCGSPTTDSDPIVQEINRTGAASVPVDQRSQNVWEYFNKGKEVGHGAYGRAFKCTEKGSNAIFCVKEIEKAPKDRSGRECPLPQEEIDGVRKEIQVLKKLSHSAAPYVVQLHSSYETPKEFHLAMEFLAGGELLARVQEREHYSEKTAAMLMRTILQAIEFCHEHHICHRDIKLDNYVFIDERFIENGGVLKLIDMGFAEEFVNGGSMTGTAGTYRYMAPEVITQRSYDEKVDVWSVGVIMYCLLCGTFPGFNIRLADGRFAVDRSGHKETLQPTDEEKVLQMKHGCEVSGTNSKGAPAYWKTQNAHGVPMVSQQAQSLMLGMMAHDPKKRLSASEALKHPWISESNVASDEPITGYHDGKTLMQRIKRNYCSSKLKSAAIILMGKHLDQRERDQLRAQFKKIDKNGDGLISPVELQESMVAAGKHALDEESIDRLLRDIDVNGNGGLDFEEFVAANLKDQVLDQESKLHDTFEDIDVDHTGYLTVASIQKVLKTDEKTVKDIIAELDVDSDGKVSYMEFLLLMARHDDTGKLKDRLLKTAQSSGHITNEDARRASQADLPHLRKPESVAKKALMGEDPTRM